jgi:acid phosphatase (class A)
MFIGEILTELAPDRGAALINWGLAFGDSRVICGFHYPTDVTAGRLAAGALLARLHANEAFKADLAQAGREVQAARTATSPKFSARRPVPLAAASQSSPPQQETRRT